MCGQKPYFMKVSWESNKHDCWLIVCRGLSRTTQWTTKTQFGLSCQPDQIIHINLTPLACRNRLQRLSKHPINGRGEKWNGESLTPLTLAQLSSFGCNFSSTSTCCSLCRQAKTMAAKRRQTCNDHSPFAVIHLLSCNLGTGDLFGVSF